MSMTIQRPADAATALCWPAPKTPFPINSQLVVGPEECVVASLDGVILGVIPPGNHWLHPQPFPFLGKSVVGDASLRAELWFVRTTRIAGLQLGGPLASVVNPVTQVPCHPRGFGELSLVVLDAPRLVTSIMGQFTGAEAAIDWVKSVVMRKVVAAFVTLVEIENVGVLDMKLPLRLQEAVEGQLGELEPAGLKFGGLGSFHVSFSDEDAAALKGAMVKKAAAARASRACAGCGASRDAGRFCTACGTAYAS